LQGVGRIYRQTFVDTYSKWSAAKLYSTKTPITAADLLNDQALPFFEEQLPCRAPSSENPSPARYRSSLKPLNCFRCDLGVRESLANSRSIELLVNYPE